jgi:hypothetical protein
MPLKDVESWLKRGQYVQFLREICPRKIYPQKWSFIDRHSMKAVKSSPGWFVWAAPSLLRTRTTIPRAENRKGVVLVASRQ